ncbi:NIPSNAP protein [Paenibacillus tianmuensis]|uniref:NIPSNAP protein n=1 Tax=Paenibacillus tianmuensis TaxID=624147 RepID=A0A1G4U148_9BACL|nr:NIPSNAP family protein [Paenibacillus tianmuensis]SCW87318.1 NIPSNAP protein [Paenibacillus tianmuensis]
MSRVIEILLYTLKPGTGGEFHRIMQEISVPLHRKVGMDVVAYGNSLHDPDAYYLIRSYDSLDHLGSSQDAFYKSEAWRNGPRVDIIERISTSLKSVVSLSPEAIDELRRSGL